MLDLRITIDDANFFEPIQPARWRGHAANAVALTASFAGLFQSAFSRPRWCRLNLDRCIGDEKRADDHEIQNGQ